MAVDFVEVVIAANAAVSGPFPFNGRRVIGVVSPATWTAADISFEIEYPNGTFVKVVTVSGVLMILSGISATVSEFHSVGGGSIGTQYIITGHGAGRVVSTNTASEADVNQAAARTLLVILADI